MRVIAMLLVTTALSFAGCQYQSPLTKKHTISIDSSVLGLWEPVPEKGKEQNPNQRMMILKYSDTEYLIRYPLGEDGLSGQYFRGYSIKIGNVPCVQLQFIGFETGPPDKYGESPFLVLSYVLANGELEVKLLNTDLVDVELKDSKALRKAFIRNQGNKDLFTDHGKFRRIKD